MPPFTLRHEIPPVELAPGVAMSFKVIPPVSVQQAALANGHPLSFMMGSRDGKHRETPRHRVVIPQPFCVGTFPVTQQQFSVWTRSSDYFRWFEANRHRILYKPEKHSNYFRGNDLHPAENLSWYEARGFTEWLNSLKILPPEFESYTARLPCEAEWEYACRAGTDTEYSIGDGEAALEKIGWFRQKSALGTTHPVGMKAPNAWGLFDLHGNVFEWCEDVFDPNAYAKREHPWVARPWAEDDAGGDAVRDDGVPHHVVRGGAWSNAAGWCRSADRDWRHPGIRFGDPGFRVFLALPGPAGPEDHSGVGAGLPQSEEANT
jgi:formylglycine-generating enzyme required for sulfatase activity